MNEEEKNSLVEILEGSFDDIDSRAGEMMEQNGSALTNKSHSLDGVIQTTYEICKPRSCSREILRSSTKLKDRKGHELCMGSDMPFSSVERLFHTYCPLYKA